MFGVCLLGRVLLRQSQVNINKAKQNGLFIFLLFDNFCACIDNAALLGQGRRGLKKVTKLKKSRKKSFRSVDCLL
jgi:hypothetical protein